MKSIADEYCNSVKKEMIVWFANWEPSTSLKLGDYGTLSGNVFVKWGNIKDREIKFKTLENKTRSNKYLTSKKGVSCKINPKVSLKKGIEKKILNANMEVEFGQAKAFFLNTCVCGTSMIQDKYKLGKEVEELIKKREWKKEHVIVTDIMESDNTTLAISSNGSSSLLLEAQSPLVKKINMADASLDFKIQNHNFKGYSITSKDKMIPFIGLCGIQPKIFAKAEFKPILKKLPKLTSSFLYATGKASGSALNQGIPLNNIENSLRDFQNKLELNAGITYIGNDFNKGTTIDFDDIDINNLKDLIYTIDDPDLDFLNEISEKFEKSLNKNKDNIDLDFTEILDSLPGKNKDYRFGQII